ncbi:Uncharacterised protein [Helicobacter mustelae]|nr:Uncharacterised protein [Helicobacter mustelae]
MICTALGWGLDATCCTILSLGSILCIWDSKYAACIEGDGVAAPADSRDITLCFGTQINTQGILPLFLSHKGARDLSVSQVSDGISATINGIDAPSNPAFCRSCVC